MLPLLPMETKLVMNNVFRIKFTLVIECFYNKKNLQYNTFSTIDFVPTKGAWLCSMSIGIISRK